MQIKDLASLIAFHRKKAGLTQVELAEFSGVSRFVVQDLEAGNGRTSWRHIESILQSLNLELEPKGSLVEAWRQEKESTK